jgi:hypothetical protein
MLVFRPSASMRPTGDAAGQWGQLIQRDLYWWKERRRCYLCVIWRRDHYFGPRMEQGVRGGSHNAIPYWRGLCYRSVILCVAGHIPRRSNYSVDQFVFNEYRVIHILSIIIFTGGFLDTLNKHSAIVLIYMCAVSKYLWSFCKQWYT